MATKFSMHLYPNNLVAFENTYKVEKIIFNLILK